MLITEMLTAERRIIKVKRNLSLSRLYSLGNYKNIRFDDSIDDLSAEILTNKELVDNLRLLQMLSVELAFRRYLKLNQDMLQNLSLEDAIEELDKVRGDVYMSIKKLLQNGNIQEDTISTPEEIDDND